MSDLKQIADWKELEKLENLEPEGLPRLLDIDCDLWIDGKFQTYEQKLDQVEKGVSEKIRRLKSRDTVACSRGNYVSIEADKHIEVFFIPVQFYKTKKDVGCEVLTK
ncbi:hypothetical protein HOK51_00830 [Candidatus Woesearchaeota archaeon]|jgi:hypothetical protein|nr:hypothetical protein [Candidatus Woesearchaeota archaeon]MBT6518359.1 hypothetical protein [Candidatus Woesearchaeota archaeon]MBT7367291.1 hypothetical protein [Candidatus Woesearchaeota archaeon]